MKATGKGDYVRAGLFVLAGITVFVVVVFSIGRKSELFAPTDTLYVSFGDVNGLSVGAPVRLSGLEVGSVEAIAFPEDLRTKSARVKLAVRSAYMERIRADSRATIDSSGLLGDKIINISVGDPARPRLSDGATLQVGETLTFEALASSLHDAIGSVKAWPSRPSSCSDRRRTARSRATFAASPPRSRTCSARSRPGQARFTG